MSLVGCFAEKACFRPFHQSIILLSFLKHLWPFTWGQKAAYIRRNLPMVERVFKILKLIVISPHDSIKCQSWEGFEKITFCKKAHFYTIGQNHVFVVEHGQHHGFTVLTSGTALYPGNNSAWGLPVWCDGWMMASEQSPERVRSTWTKVQILSFIHHHLKVMPRSCLFAW